MMKQSDLIILAEKTAKGILAGEPGKLEPIPLLKFSELLGKEIRLQSFLKILASVKKRKDPTPVNTEDEFCPENTI